MASSFVFLTNTPAGMKPAIFRRRRRRRGRRGWGGGGGRKEEEKHFLNGRKLNLWIRKFMSYQEGTTKYLNIKKVLNLNSKESIPEKYKNK